MAEGGGDHEQVLLDRRKKAKLAATMLSTSDSPIMKESPNSNIGSGWGPRQADLPRED